MNDTLTPEETIYRLRQFAKGAAQLLEEMNTDAGILRRLEEPHFVIGQLAFYVKQFVALSEN